MKTPRHPSRLTHLELLERRELFAANLYIDFGDNFPADGLDMKVSELAGPLTAGGINGPNYGDRLKGDPSLKFQGLGAYLNGPSGFDFDGNGVRNNADLQALQAGILQTVRREYEPFDVNVVAAPLLDNSSDAAYRAGIVSTLQPGANVAGERDTWIFVGSITSGGTTIWNLAKGISSGEAHGSDIGGDNATDDSGVVLVDYMLQPNTFFNDVSTNKLRGSAASFALGDNISHEAGHNFGLQHIYDTQNTRDAQPTARSSIMGYGLNWDQQGVFSRYPERSDYNLTGPGRPGPAIMSYDRLIGNRVLGKRTGSAEYVTGTGMHDVITIQPSGTNRATVFVQAFENANYTKPIDVPGPNGTFTGTDVAQTRYTVSGSLFSYEIDTSHGVRIDAGEGADQIVIDGDLGTNVTVNGMGGEDKLWIPTQTVHAALYTPGQTGRDAGGNSDWRGTIQFGGTNVAFTEFEAASTVAILGYIVPDLAATGRTLIASGTNGNDAIVFEYSDVNHIRVLLNGVEAANYSAARVARIAAHGFNGNDVIVNSLLPQRAEFFGDAGDDTLYGGSANDALQGGDGNDFLYGYAGSDALYGGSGNDFLFGGDGNDWLQGGLGNDFLYGENGSDILFGDQGNDRLFGGNGDDLLIGGEGVDALYGDAGNDLLIGGTTVFGTDAAAWRLVSLEWTSNRSFSQRRDNLRNGTGPILAGKFAGLRGGVTVLRDFEVDTVVGGEGTNWLFNVDKEDSLI